MSSEPIRPEVVQAILKAFTTPGGARQDIVALNAAPAECAAADELVAASKVAMNDHQNRISEVWSLLLRRQWDREPTMVQLFDEVTPEVQSQLTGLYDALPDDARAEFDRRYGRPNL